MKIPSRPTLTDLQRYLSDLCQARGWTQASDVETFLLFSEEVGELAKAIRKRNQLFVETGTHTDPQELAHELADVLSYLLELANRFEVDLEQAFREKEALNSQRDWGTHS